MMNYVDKLIIDNVDSREKYNNQGAATIRISDQMYDGIWRLV